jgi:SAM-dependent methyltransferase
MIDLPSEFVVPEKQETGPELSTFSSNEPYKFYKFGNFEAEISPFIRNAIRYLKLDEPLNVLDIPSGFGRHSLYFASIGHRVVSGDLDCKRLDFALNRWNNFNTTRLGVIMPVLLNAEAELPFEIAVFDLVIVVHSLIPNLIQRVAGHVRPGGFLLFETVGFQGHNCVTLPKKGESTRGLEDFIIKFIRERPNKKNNDNRVSVQLIAQKLF